MAITIPAFQNRLLLIPCTGAVAYPNARFGQGTGPIFVNNLQCTGTENTIFDCMSDGLGSIGTCSHADDASVMCQEGWFYILHSLASC